MSEIPKLLTIAELTTRWEMPRQSIHDRINYREFSNPVHFVSNGRTALFLENDFEEFEKKILGLLPLNVEKGDNVIFIL